MKIAIFDLDGTLVAEETLPFMIKAWGALGYSKARQLNVMVKIYAYYFIYKLKVIKSFDKQVFRTKAMEIFLELFKGMREKQINQFFEECFELLKDRFSATVIEELYKAQSNQFRTVLLSGSFKPFVEIVGKCYGFNDVLGSDITYDDNKYIDYRNPTRVNMGNEKLETILNHFSNTKIDWESSKAFADSYYDLDILKKVGLPVAVNPDEGLKIYAENNKWTII